MKSVVTSMLHVWCFVIALYNEVAISDCSVIAPLNLYNEVVYIFCLFCHCSMDGALSLLYIM
jgi:hypothetical protein